MRFIAVFILTVLALSASAFGQISYFNQGLLRQTTRELDLKYLGISTVSTATNRFTTQAQPFVIYGIIAPGATTSSYPYVVTIPGASTNTVWPAAGTNTTAQTNGLVVTINANVSHAEVSNAVFVASNALFSIQNGSSNALWIYTTGVSNSAWAGSNALWFYSVGVSNNAWIGSNALSVALSGVSNNVLSTSNVLWGYTGGVSNILFAFTNSLAGVLPNQFTTNTVGAPIVGTVTFDQSYHTNAYRLSTNSAFSDEELITEKRAEQLIASTAQQMWHFDTNINPVLSSNFSFFAIEAAADQWLTNTLALGSNRLAVFYQTNALQTGPLPGAYNVHFHALPTGTGNPTVVLGFDLLMWSHGTNKTIHVGDNTTLVLGLEDSVDLSLALETAATLDDTNNLLGVRLWAVRTGGASATLRTRYAGTVDCFFTGPAQAGQAISSTFVTSDPLTNRVYFTNLVGGREILISNRVYYLDVTNGNNANTGLTVAQSWKTIQFALDQIANSVDMGSNFTVTVQLTNGLYAENINGRVNVGGNPIVTIQGDLADTNHVIITSASGTTIQAGSPGVLLTLQGFSIGSGTGGVGLGAAAGGIINISGNFQFLTNGFAISVATMGLCRSTGTPKIGISGGGNNFFNITQNGFGRFQNAVWTVNGTPAITAFANADTSGALECSGSSFTGSATGKRFAVNLNAMINTGSSSNLTFFPGNATGTSTLGGIYQ